MYALPIVSLCVVIFDSETGAIDSQIDDKNKTFISLTDFFLCEFIQCRFRKAIITIADFRYTHFTDCSLGETKINYGDFYMAAFKGTISFDGCEMKECSLTNTVFENECVRLSSIHKLIQENYTDYIDIFYENIFTVVQKRDNKIKCKWYRRDQCSTIGDIKEYEIGSNQLRSKSQIRLEASQVYAQLSGIYSSKGFFKDSNRAYRLAKINSTLHFWYALQCDYKKDKCATVKDVYHILSTLKIRILGYGYQLKKVVCWYTLLIVVYASAFRSKVGDCVSWCTAIGLSLKNSVGSENCFICFLGEIWSSAETVFGLLLIGYAGFIIANRMRNHY